MMDINFTPHFNCVLKKNADNDYALLSDYRRNFYATDNKFICEGNLITFNSLDEFSCENIQGRFDVTVDSLHLKCCLIDSPSKNKNEYLYVSYTGARPDKNITNPNFPRWSYYKIREACFLGIDDPMFSVHPDLLLGWYYGSKNRCYVDSTIKLIKKICTEKSIPSDKCVFFSSSGGGYASIIASILLPKSLSISINPQLYINEYAYAKKFSEITGIKLDDEDALLRNNLVKKILKESYSKHVIIVNLRSDSDYSKLLKFANEFGIQSLRYGLNLIAPNVLIWIYDAVPEPSKSAHTAFETKQLYKFIEYISLEFKNNPEFDCDKYQSLAVMINEIWFSISELKNKNSDFTEHTLKFFDNSSPICTSLVQRIDNIQIQKSDSNYNFYSVPITKIFSSHYSIVISKVSSNVKEFSYGLYDWKYKKFIRQETTSIESEREYILNFYIDSPVDSQISFVIYAGVYGKTSNNSINIKKLSVYSNT